MSSSSDQVFREASGRQGLRRYGLSAAALAGRVCGALALGIWLSASTAHSETLDWPMKPVLTLEAARRVAAVATQEAHRTKTPCVIAITDDGGHLILLERMDDAPMLASVDLAPAKARSAALFRKPTQALEEAIRNGRTAAVTAVAAGLGGFVEMTGGVPLLVQGEVVGAIVISAATPADDAWIAEMAAQALAPPAP